MTACIGTELREPHYARKLVDVDMIKHLGPESLQLAERILVAQGSATYLQDWEAELALRIRSATIPAGSEPVIARPNAQGIPERYRLRVTEMEASTRRRFAYGKLLKASVELYRAYVKLTPSPNPVTITFARQPAWDGLRSEGWESAEQRFGKTRAEGGVTLRDNAWYLSVVRQEIKSLDETEKAARQELARLIQREGIQSYDYDSARLRVGLSKPKEEIDIEAAAAHPVLSQFIYTSTSKPYKRVWFERVKDTDEEPLDL